MDPSTVAAEGGLCPARGNQRLFGTYDEGGGSWGNHGFPHGFRAFLLAGVA